ncbi:hypothetical protein L9F63_006792, partial [Diploptera punctata]
SDEKIDAPRAGNIGASSLHEHLAVVLTFTGTSMKEIEGTHRSEGSRPLAICTL